LPSVRAATRKATSGGRKSVSPEATPRIHQGLAVAELAPQQRIAMINEIRAADGLFRMVAL
jgi:hypothetical protein